MTWSTSRRVSNLAEKGKGANPFLLALEPPMKAKKP